MSRLATGARVVSLMCLFVMLTGRLSSALSLGQLDVKPTFPKDPKDPFYNAFRTIPSDSVTADKLLTNFLEVPQNNGHSIFDIFVKRSIRIDDNVIVMDGSGSVGSCEFKKAKEAVKWIMELDDPAKVDAKFAAVTFSGSATVNFKFMKPSSAKKEIMKIRYPWGSTNTQAGLAEAKKLFDDPFSGRRYSPTRKEVLLVTDGQSNVKPTLTVPKAQALKDAGVTIHVVAVGKYDMVGIDEMVKVASCKRYTACKKPEDILIYRVKDYNGVNGVAKLMLKKNAFGKWLIAQGQYSPPC